MNLNELLEIYENECPYYDNARCEEAKCGDFVGIINVGTDFAKAEMFENAVACWQYVADLGKGNADVFSNLGVSYYYGNGVQQDYEKAVHYYTRAAALGHPFGMYNLAVACEYGNGTPRDMDKAIQLYRKAAEKHVNQAVDALIRLGLYDEINGLAFYGRNLNDDSFLPDSNYSSCLDRAKSKYGLAVAEFSTIMGEVYKEDAIKLFLKAISYEETSEAYFYLASLYKDFKDYDNAIKYYKETIRMNPISYEGYNDMGYCYYQKEDDVNALECFQKSYEINPNSISLRNMGNCYKNLREFEQAKQCYKKADILEKD